MQICTCSKYSWYSAIRFELATKNDLYLAISYKMWEKIEIL